MREHEAVTKARNNGDIGVLIAGLGILLGLGFVAFSVGFVIALGADQQTEDGLLGFIFENLGYIALGLALLGGAMMMTRIMRQTMLGNALHIEYSGYAWLRDWANGISADLSMPKVEIFVTQDPVMNAFALGFYGPYTIVLNSGTIRYMTADELKMVVLHEMAHVKYHHTKINVYLQFINAYPIIGAISQYVLDFWGRRAELTADRLALTYSKNPELVKSALIKVSVGPDVAKDFNQTARDWQAYNTKGFFNSFSQTLSSHPFLVKRLRNIDQSLHLIQGTSLQQPQTEPHAAN